MQVLELLELLSRTGIKAHHEIVVLSKDGTKSFNVNDVYYVNVSSKDGSVLPYDMDEDQKSIADKVVAIEVF